MGEANQNKKFVNNILNKTLAHNTSNWHLGTPSHSAPPAIGSVSRYKRRVVTGKEKKVVLCARNSLFKFYEWFKPCNVKKMKIQSHVIYDPIRLENQSKSDISLFQVFSSYIWEFKKILSFEIFNAELDCYW